MAHERTCIVDMTGYKYCSKCKDYNAEETWRYLYCSENCKAIYEIYDEYRQGRMTAEDAVAKFEKLDMPAIDKFHNIMKPVIEEIYTKTVKAEVVEEPVIEADPVFVQDVEPVKIKKKNKHVVNEFVNDIIADEQEPIITPEEI